MQDVIKKKGGRTKGAVSFCEVTLKELNRVLKEEAIITVGRVFAENLNLSRTAIVMTPALVKASKPLDFKVT